MFLIVDTSRQTFKPYFESAVDTDKLLEVFWNVWLQILTHLDMVSNVWAEPPFDFSVWAQHVKQNLRIRSEKLHPTCQLLKQLLDVWALLSRGRAQPSSINGRSVAHF